MSGRSGLCQAGRGILLGAAVAVVAAADVATTAVAAAQIELAAIVGTITDESGQPLAGVTIRLRDPERGRDVEIESDENGRFYRRGLRAIEYELTVEKEGYQPIRDKLALRAGVEQRFTFELARAAPAGAEEFGRGVEAFNRGDHQAAAEAFEAALQKAPDVPEVHVNLGLAYLRLGRAADAAAQLEKAAALAPDHAAVQFQLGGAYLEMNRLAASAAALERGLALQSDPADPLTWDATATLGAVYFAQGENDKAIAQFEKALAVKPDAVAVTLALGKAHFSKGQTERAVQLFERVVSSAPDSPEAAEASRFLEELKKAQPGS